MCNHFLLTRFNLPLWNFDKTGSQSRTDGWLEERFMLFERYCLPSVAKQTCKNFVWLVLFDENTPNHYKKIVDSYAADCPQFNACYLSTEESKNYVAHFSLLIKSWLANKNCEQIITTRLDNDDAISANYIANIQHYVKNAQQCAHDFCISFPWGLQYYEKWNYTHKILFPNNHFLTFVENDVSNLKNVYSISHMDAAKQQTLVSVRNKQKPMWIEVVHQKNVSNDVKIKYIQYPFYFNANLATFGLDNIHSPLIKNIHIYIFKFLPRLFTHTLQHNRLFGWKTNLMK